MTVHYPQWNYITVQSFVFTSAIVTFVEVEEDKEEEEGEDELVKGTF